MKIIFKTRNDYIEKNHEWLKNRFEYIEDRISESEGRTADSNKMQMSEQSKHLKGLVLSHQSD
jgi:hypothetical protein